MGRAAAAAITVALTAPGVAQARDTIAPKPPTRLNATIGDGRVVLKWRKSTDNVAVRRYRVYRRAPRRAWPRTALTSIRAAKRRKVSLALKDGARYYFRVKAIDGAGNLSRASNQVRAKAPAGTCALFGPYGTGRRPGACWRPFAATSPFNRRIPERAPSAPRSSAIISRLLSWGAAQGLLAGHADTKHDSFHPIYYSRASDPLYTVRCQQWTSSCAVEGAQIRIPSAARAAGGGDGHMAVIDQASGWEYDFWQVHSKPAGGGTIRVSHGGRTRIDGDGLGTNATAAWFALSAGIIRAGELRAGAINHALFAQIKCTAGESVYPAQPGTTAAPCSRFGLSNADAPPLGARIALDMTNAEISALAVPGWKKTILKALAEYGMIVGDTNGGNAAWGIQGESGSGYTSFGAADPWRAFSQNVDAPTWDGMYVFNMAAGVDWTRLRVIAPCASKATC